MTSGVSNSSCSFEEIFYLTLDLPDIQSMVVHPDYQGQGIAGRLLSRGLEEVDRAGQDIYLEGTAAGRRLYLRHGFEDLEDIDMESVDYKIVAMMRHPQKSAAS